MGNVILEQLIKLFTNFWFGDTIRKGKDFKNVNEYKTQYGDRDEECHKLQNREYIVKIKADEAKDDDEISKINRMPFYLVSFLGNGKRLMNHFII